MKRHLTNSAYSVLDYASYPLGMLLVAPIVLHRLGASEYGLWMVSTAVISAGGIIASGFSDANIQHAAHLRGTGKLDPVPRTVRSILGINLVLGFTLASIAWIAAPYAASHIAGADRTSADECLSSLRIASVSILIRSIETVAVSTQRAFEAYGGAVRISTTVRLLTLASAAALAQAGHGTTTILLATAIFLALGTCMQFRQLGKYFPTIPMRPLFLSAETRILLRKGVFVWMQELGAVVFGQLDRILLGISMGALAVAPYSLCVQFAQPLFGLSASALHFLFPYLSGRASTLSSVGLRRTLLKAFGCNLLLVGFGAGILLVFGDRLIRLWAGAAVAQSAAGILMPIILGSALMGLGVTGTYAMQALGRFREVALISLGSRTAMLLLMIQLLHRMGPQGLAVSRLCYGSIALLVYLPLLRQLSVGKTQRESLSPMPIPYSIQEEAKP
jgi:O-antigen/teichoic acid export membrane protein